MHNVWRAHPAEHQAQRSEVDSLRELHSERRQRSELSANTNIRLTRWRYQVRGERAESERDSAAKDACEEEERYDCHKVHDVQWHGRRYSHGNSPSAIASHESAKYKNDDRSNGDVTAEDPASSNPARQAVCLATAITNASSSPASCTSSQSDRASV